MSKLSSFFFLFFDLWWPQTIRFWYFTRPLHQHLFYFNVQRLLLFFGRRLLFLSTFVQTFRLFHHDWLSHYDWWIIWKHLWWVGCLNGCSCKMKQFKHIDRIAVRKVTSYCFYFILAKTNIFDFLYKLNCSNTFAFVKIVKWRGKQLP